MKKNKLLNAGTGKKKLKGMTLLEVILAMTVMTILAVILIQSCIGIINHIRISKNVAHKVNVQSAPVENRSVAGDAYAENDVIELNYGGTKGEITVNRFQAPEIPEDELLKGALDAGDLKYFVLVK